VPMTWPIPRNASRKLRNNDRRDMENPGQLNGS